MVGTRSGGVGRATDSQEASAVQAEFLEMVDACCI
jgi:hypothetical protein